MTAIDVLGLVGTLATVVGSAIGVAAFIGRRAKKWVTVTVAAAAKADQTALDGMRRAIVAELRKDLDTGQIAEIHTATRQLVPNGGAHLADKIRATDKRLGELDDKLDTVKSKVDTLTGAFTEHIRNC